MGERVNQMTNYPVIIGAAEMGSANMRKPAVSRMMDLRVTRPIRVNLGGRSFLGNKEREESKEKADLPPFEGS